MIIDHIPSHGRNSMQLDGSKHCPVQQQHTHRKLGNFPGIPAFHCHSKLGGGTCPLPQKAALLPANTTTHQGKREHHDRHTIGSVPQWHFNSNNDSQTFFNSHFPLPNQTSWNVFQLHSNVAMRVILILRTTHFFLDEWQRLPKNWVANWNYWTQYVTSLGMDPYLQDTPFAWQIRALTGFAARAQQGAFGAGCKIQSRTVSGYITSIGQTIALACETNPVKILGSDKFLTRLQQMLDGWCHEDPPTSKKLPVESDLPKFLVNESGHRLATALDHAVADLTTIVFYYLLQIGEYTVKGTRNKTKRTVQFKMEDVTFFKKDKRGCIMCLSRNAPLADILSADGATVKLDNQKNGHKGVCVYQQTTGNSIHCPVRTLG
jgi:hypothetical protein